MEIPNGNKPHRHAAFVLRFRASDEFASREDSGDVMRRCSVSKLQDLWQYQSRISIRVRLAHLDSTSTTVCISSSAALLANSTRVFQRSVLRLGYATAA